MIQQEAVSSLIVLFVQRIINEINHASIRIERKHASAILVSDSASIASVDK